MPTKQEIIEHCHSGKLSKILKGEGDANTRHLVCFEVQETPPIKCHLTRNWLVDTRKHVEEGCFSRAVRTNHREQLSRPHLERDISQCFDPGNAYRNALDVEQVGSIRFEGVGAGWPVTHVAHLLAVRPSRIVLILLRSPPSCPPTLTLTAPSS